MPSDGYTNKRQKGRYTQSKAKSADHKLSVPKRKSSGKRLGRYAKDGFGGLRKASGKKK